MNSAILTAMTRWLTDDEQAAWRALVAVMTRLTGALDRQLQHDAGMPHAYYGVLVRLSEAPGRALRMHEIARELDYSPSRLSHAVARMEAAGWVERRPCQEDRRSTWCVLTDEGFRVLEESAPGHVEAVREHVIDALTPAQVGQLQAICEAIMATMDVPAAPVECDEAS